MDHGVDIGEQRSGEPKGHTHPCRRPDHGRDHWISQHRETDRLAVVEDRLALSGRQPEFPDQGRGEGQAVVDDRRRDLDPPGHGREQYCREREQLEKRIADDQQRQHLVIMILFRRVVDQLADALRGITTLFAEAEHIVGEHIIFHQALDAGRIAALGPDIESPSDFVGKGAVPDQMVGLFLGPVRVIGRIIVGDPLVDIAANPCAKLRFGDHPVDQQALHLADIVEPAGERTGETDGVDIVELW